MTVGKASLLTAGLVATFALGVVTAPTIRDSWSKIGAPKTTAAAPAAERSAHAPVQLGTRARSSPRAHAAVAAKEASNVVRTVPVFLWDSEMRDRVKAVLNPGSRLEAAAADFGDGEQFMTVAHAARNTNVPFMVLKDRVLNQRESLADAIHELKPALDAKAEVAQARAEALSDLAVGD